MAITSLDDVAAAISVAQRRPFFKSFSAPKAAGSWESGWLASGFPTAGSAPPVYTSGSGYTSSAATVGALSYTNPSVQNWLAQFIGCSTQSGTLILMDRLWSCSGMGFASATYTVTTPGSLPARVTDNGASAELWIENFVATGATTAVTLTANYLDSTGSAQTGSTPIFQSGAVAGQMQYVQLASGNNGIKQLTSAVINGTLTSGTFGMTILKRYLSIAATATALGYIFDFTTVPLLQLPSNACLMFLACVGSANGVTIVGSMDIIDK